MSRDAESIFHAARHQTGPTERSAYLDGACGKDVGLRAKVEALLTAERRRGELLEDVRMGIEGSRATWTPRFDRPPMRLVSPATFD